MMTDDDVFYLFSLSSDTTDSTGDNFVIVLAETKNRSLVP